MKNAMRHKDRWLRWAGAIAVCVLMAFAMTACNDDATDVANADSQPNVTEDNAGNTEPQREDKVVAGTRLEQTSIYTDVNGDKAYIPAQFMVSFREGEQTINTGLVVIGPDESEYVWIPTDVTKLSARDFGRYFNGGTSLSGYFDDSSLADYNEMVSSVERFGGFYMGRYEASKGDNGQPASKRITPDNPGRIWVQFSPQDTTIACQSLYSDNDSVSGFFPWGCNYDTTLQWLVDSGNKSINDIQSDSTSWGNYSNDTFSDGAGGNYTGMWEEAKANNIYDLAGNNWEWTQERYGSNYVMRSGGYNLMGGSCPGNVYPAAIRDPLPGNNHHPNVTFRVGLYVR